MQNTVLHSRLILHINHSMHNIFGKGGLLKGPESSFCSLSVTLSGCDKADWELLVSLPSKFKYTPDVNMSPICLRCGFPVSHLFSAWVLTGVGMRVRQFCSEFNIICVYLVQFQI